MSREGVRIFVSCHGVRHVLLAGAPAPPSASSSARRVPQTLNQTLGQPEPVLRFIHHYSREKHSLEHYRREHEYLDARRYGEGLLRRGDQEEVGVEPDVREGRGRGSGVSSGVIPLLTVSQSRDIIRLYSGDTYGANLHAPRPD